MRTKLAAGVVGLAAVAALTAGGVAAASAPASAPSAQPTQQSARALGAVGLTADGRSLVGFTTNDPGRATNPVPVRGLVGDTRLVGIDFRVQDGKIYGVGDRGGLYTNQGSSPEARKIGQLTVALSGTAFGVDFNPAANALRVISDTGQNLRQPFANADTGAPLAATAVDTPLTLPATAPATGTVPANGFTAAAYTNNDTVATTATTLFDIGTGTDQVAIQSPANSGTLAPTGALGVNAAGDAGFDIYSSARGNEAFAVLQVGSARGLYRVDVLTGQATPVGTFRAPVSDLAVAPNQG